jgi:hypothetical protein
MSIIKLKRRVTEDDKALMSSLVVYIQNIEKSIQGLNNVSMQLIEQYESVCEKYNLCPECGGDKGSFVSGNWFDCDRCDGSGEYQEEII